MKELGPAEKTFWEDYLDELPKEERPNNAFVEADFAGTKETTDELIDLYLEGKKTAGSSIENGYALTGTPIPKVGNYWIVLDSKNQPRLILKTVQVALNKFKDVPAEIAEAEGEGDSSLASWKKVHSEFWTPHLAEWGLQKLDSATVVTEYFEFVYPLELDEEDEEEDDDEDEDKELDKKSDKSRKLREMTKQVAMLTATAIMSAVVGAAAGFTICQNSKTIPSPLPAPTPSPVASTKPAPTPTPTPPRTTPPASPVPTPVPPPAAGSAAGAPTPPVEPPIPPPSDGTTP